MTLLLWTYSRHTPSQLCTVIVQFTRCIDANGDRQLSSLGPDCHILVLVLVLPLGFGQQDYALREKRKHANA